MKNGNLFICLLLISVMVMPGMAQTPDSRTISTHILDTTLGQPAVNVPVTLSRLDQGGSWLGISKATTNIDGRVNQLISLDLFQDGIYKLHFDTCAYNERQSVKSFYPFIEIIFECKAGEHYHVPLLLNPYGYSTYRGS